MIFSFFSVGGNGIIMKGRPTKLTNELLEKIVGLLKKGHTKKGACGKVGITERTLYYWVEKGESHKTNTIFKRLATEIEIAEEAGQAEYEDVIHEDAIINRNAKTAMWRLEQMDPKNYGKNKLQAEITSENKTEVTVKKISIDPKVDEELNDLLRPRYITTSEEPDDK